VASVVSRLTRSVRCVGSAGRARVDRRGPGDHPLDGEPVGHPGQSGSTHPLPRPLVLQEPDEQRLRFVDIAQAYRAEPLVDYSSFLETNADLFDASWSWLINRGIFMTPGNEEQWTLSVQHEVVHIDRFVDIFGEFCATVAR